MASHYVDDTSRQRRGTERIDRGVVGVKFEGDMGVAQRNTLEFGLDLCGRSRTLVEETTAGGTGITLRTDILSGTVLTIPVFDPLAAKFGTALLARLLFGIVVARYVVELVGVSLERGET